MTSSTEGILMHIVTKAKHIPKGLKYKHFKMVLNIHEKDLNELHRPSDVLMHLSTTYKRKYWRRLLDYNHSSDREKT